MCFVLLQVLLEGAAVRVVCVCVCKCRCKVLLEGVAVRFGAGMLVLLQGAVVRVACALWSWPAGVAAGCCFQSGACVSKVASWCRCGVLLLGAAEVLLCGLERVWWCRCRVLLQGATGAAAGCYRCRCRVLLQGSAVRVVCCTGYCCQTVMYNEACVLVSLRCLWQCGC